MYILSPEMTSEEVEKKARELESAIQNNEGIILKQQNPAARTLSYQIKKHASGYFGILEFQIEPEKLLEIKAMVVKDGKIVRHMVLIKKPVRIKKQRRSKRDALAAAETLPSIEGKTEKSEIKEEIQPVEEKPVEKPKVDLEDIDKQLDEILGE